MLGSPLRCVLGAAKRCRDSAGRQMTTAGAVQHQHRQVWRLQSRVATRGHSRGKTRRRNCHHCLARKTWRFRFPGLLAKNGQSRGLLHGIMRTCGLFWPGGKQISKSPFPLCTWPDEMARVSVRGRHFLKFHPTDHPRTKPHDALGDKFD